MNTNPTRTTRSPLFPKSSHEGHSDGQHTDGIISKQTSNTARYSNDITIVRPSSSADGNDSFSLEDISSHDAGYDGDVEVIVPYEYEEADSRPLTPQKTRNGATNDAETDEIGSEGLINAMRALDCDSDITDYGNRGLHIRRRRKRKGRDLFAEQPTSDCSSDTGCVDIIDLERGRSVFTPVKHRKRRRRRAYTGDASECPKAGKPGVGWGPCSRVPYEINVFPAQVVDKMDIG
ncbi:hypothetical protein ACJ72_01085 [Emergomyces africanus]|uniref:Uncharacterized protein n=1 Tax=Emergomyces africanus TaxID=1955775 RepID=A0A1B7P688_9EURO|nr:hypothetical protein ACJ72_01085 [Emergomyces africanus]